MGIHWNCLAADTLSRTSVAAPVPDSDSDSDSDSPRDSILKLVDVDASPVDSAEYSCCFTMVTACISTWMSNISGENNVILGALDNSKLRDFTYEELRAATFNFSMNLLIGRGGFGNVYKGWLKEQRSSKGARNRPVAVKRLSGRSHQGYLEFTTEISLLGMVSHPNIVKLLGFFRANEEKILVYEYMQKRSLDYHLFSKKPERVLSWEIRLKIAIEIAEGLSYLHSLEHPVILKDIKPSNVLLDKCGKCHKAGHYTRSCDKISHVGGNSKLPNASEAITEERTSSTQSTVQQDSERSEASVAVTKTLQTTPSNSNLLDASDGTSNEKTSTIQSPHLQQGSKGDEENRIGTNKPRNNHLIRKTTAVGGNSKALEARNTTKKERTNSSRLTVQQGNTRKEANGVATRPSWNNVPKTKIPSNSKLLNATDAMKKEKISTTKSIVGEGKKRNEANGVGASTPRSKGPGKITTSN